MAKITNDPNNGCKNSNERFQQVRDKDFLIKRRQGISQLIFNLWTQEGSDLSCIAPALFDGRLDALGRYTMRLGYEEDDDENSSNRQHISVRESSSLSYQEFRTEYMLPNIPVIINGLTKDWQARKKWTMPKDSLRNGESSESNNNDGKRSPHLVPNLEYIKNEYFQEVAPVHRQRKAGFTISRPVKEDMTIVEYADWWQEYHERQHQKEQQATNDEHSYKRKEEENSSSEPQQTNNEDDLLYLKDWKFVACNPTADVYQCPKYFQDDWLNGEAVGNAYKFVYLGPKGTSTRLHADVLRSFSWSTNVCGRKRWYLIPPEYTYLLVDCFGGGTSSGRLYGGFAPHLHVDMPPTIDNDNNTSTTTNCSYHTIDSCWFPGLKEARKYAIEVIQEAGETIFVPSTWYHTVENLEPTLSINHNWLNGTCIHNSWGKLRAEIDALLNKTEIANTTICTTSSATDNKDDTSQVGDDLLLLWLVVSKKALEILRQGKDEESDRCDDIAGVNSIRIFDIRAILPILEEIRLLIQQNQDFGLRQRACFDGENNIDFLLSSLKETLQQS